jgi:hypothetical protein
MRFRLTYLAFLPFLILFVIGGCQNYVITTDLLQPLAPTSVCNIGDIIDELPMETEDAKKPSAEAIQKFKNRIAEEISKQEIFNPASSGVDTGFYEITGSILEYKKGSGVARFFIGFGVGNAAITTSLKLINVKTKEIVFSGNFKGSVSSWGESGDKMFERVAKDFAKALKKQNKTYLKK